MNDFFQIKITDRAREQMDQESKEFMADLGWYEEDMGRWIIVNSIVAEDYFDLSVDEIRQGIEVWRMQDGEFRSLMYFEHVGESKESLVIEFNIREVPALARYGNSGKDFIVPDDIAFQMEREMKYIAEESIPPGGGEACNWFQSEVARFFEAVK
jgi:hypothetical protein